MQDDNEPWGTLPESHLVVLLSSERSGSTLLRVMLGAHSRAIAPQELFLLRYPDFDTWREQKPVAIESLIEFFSLLGRPRSNAEIEAACRGRSVAEVYRWLFDHLPPGMFLLDKTPAYANDAATLTRSAVLAPFYIWLIRHPLGVIDSHVRLKVKERRNRALQKPALAPLYNLVERWSNRIPAVARQRETKWVQQNLNVRNFLRNVPGHQKAVVHFEDLVRDPEPVLRTLCAAIGIAVEPGMVRPETRRVMNPALGDPNFHLRSGIEPDLAGSWQARFEEGSLQVETLELMRQLGVLSPRLRSAPGDAA